MMFEAFAKDTMMPLLGRGSMLLIDGEPHRRERKLIMPMFHGQRMRSYAETIRDSAIRSFDARVGKGVVEMHDITTEISLDVIARALFGAFDDKRANELTDKAQAVIKHTHPAFIFSSKTQIKFFGLSPWDRFLKARQDLRKAAYREIEEREADTESRDDILTMLLNARYEDGAAMDREHLFDELGTFLFAGHETSAVGMAWAVYALLSNTESLEKLVAELEASGGEDPSAMAKLPWLGAVVNETLRIYPIVSDVLRILKSPMELGGYQIPAGFGLASAIVLTHFDSNIYPEPDRFNPQRFVDRKFDSSEFLPFGGGARRCAGAAFAIHEMAIVLGTLFSRYELTLHEDAAVVPKRRNVTIGPSTGIRVEIKPKN